MKTSLTWMTALTAAALGATLLAPAATADQPRDLGSVEVTFADVNPCTQEAHEVRASFALREHVHDSSSILFVHGSLETSDGYASRPGALTNLAVTNGGWAMLQPVHLMLTNPETGGAYQVREMYKVTADGELTMARSSLRCVRQPEG